MERARESATEGERERGMGGEEEGEGRISTVNIAAH
jgi:hypothetical protein